MCAASLDNPKIAQYRCRTDSRRSWLQVELNTAVRSERYGDAAGYKRKLQEIQASDTVAAVQRQLQVGQLPCFSVTALPISNRAEIRTGGVLGWVIRH